MTGDDPLRWAQRSRPIAGETELGDAHIVKPFDGGALVAVIDGLGHGREAAAAANLAVETLSCSPASPPAEQIERCHLALKGSRGAAMLVVSLSWRASTISWSGVGNVEGWRVAEGRREAMISRAGVVGYQIMKPIDRTSALHESDLLLLATDGIRPGFLEGVSDDLDVETLATRILSTYARPNDDALVLVARCDPRTAE